MRAIGAVLGLLVAGTFSFGCSSDTDYYYWDAPSEIQGSTFFLSVAEREGSALPWCEGGTLSFSISDTSLPASFLMSAGEAGCLDFQSDGSLVSYTNLDEDGDPSPYGQLTLEVTDPVSAASTAMVLEYTSENSGNFTLCDASCNQSGEYSMTGEFEQE